MSDALLELQAAGIPAIPDVDAIICQRQHRETACEVIGRKVYEVSGGVRCNVDGIRHSPVTRTKTKSSPLVPFEQGRSDARYALFKARLN